MFKALEGDGGHLAVVLFVLVMGATMSVFKVAEGHDLVVAATASMYTLFRVNKGEAKRDDNGNSEHEG